MKVTLAQVNHSQNSIVKTDHNPPSQKIFAEDHQIDRTHKSIHKTDIADQTVKTISIEKITLIVTTNSNYSNYNKVGHTQTIETYVIPMTVQDFLRIVEITQVKNKSNIRNN